MMIYSLNFATTVTAILPQCYPSMKAFERLKFNCAMWAPHFQTFRNELIARVHVEGTTDPCGSLTVPQNNHPCISFHQLMIPTSEKVEDDKKRL